jgi:hypothetical protein
VVLLVKLQQRVQVACLGAILFMLSTLHRYCAIFEHNPSVQSLSTISQYNPDELLNLCATFARDLFDIKWPLRVVFCVGGGWLKSAQFY